MVSPRLRRTIVQSHRVDIAAHRLGDEAAERSEFDADGTGHSAHDTTSQPFRLVRNSHLLQRLVGE
ncbi:hypothetical protein [Mycobacterium uberis]|uniref:hypothetical protein n=1 Tax=Mycobacterium uberis TaxID=2162698 RepID=UPI003C793541